MIEHIESILSDLYPDWKNNPDMVETPKRVERMYRHFFRNSEYSHIESIMSKVFPTTNDQMVIIKDIECFGMCPHHLLPIIYKIDIGYIPKGLALGLSKFARLCIAVASFPKIQENLTCEIADTLETYLKPSGVMVVVRGVHGCMRCRGVEMDSETITSDVRGVFRTVSQARSEFLNLLRR